VICDVLVESHNELHNEAPTGGLAELPCRLTASVWICHLSLRRSALWPCRAAQMIEKELPEAWKGGN